MYGQRNSLTARLGSYIINPATLI